ncbi:hypothetical protein E2C01_031353 [Portunus trituberculatus]|uniref:Secreted protein n=1 Tax=Portunus trituberculatus TaxID=210409 RepID=A0A5B7EXW3_PORTR|nr:hypothetical protein [Portunus trituberculatus]
MQLTSLLLITSLLPLASFQPDYMCSLGCMHREGRLPARWFPAQVSACLLCARTLRPRLSSTFNRPDYGPSPPHGADSPYSPYGGSGSY